MLARMRCRLLVASFVLLAAHAAAADEQQFWRYFVANKDAIGNVTRADATAAQGLAAQLKAVQPGLTFELGINTTPRDLVISADGNPALFPAVRRLVAAAPKIPGWKVTAFRPRKDGVSIEMNGVKLSVDTMKVQIHDAGDKVDILVHTGGAAADQNTKGAVFLLLDALLGEYDVETRLAGIDVQASAAPKSAVPLAKLRDVIDAKKKTSAVH
jgi:hypothetical protein